MKAFLPTLLLLAICWPTVVTAQQQPITLKDVPVGLPVISADEPMAAGFSAEKAAQYLDRSALNWVKTKKCATCHTLKNNPPKSLHHRAMLAWCSVRIDGIATEEQRKQTLAELLALQLDDGGRSTAGFLTDWKGLARDDGKPLNTKKSDGYGTGLVIVIARELGVPSDDARLQRGIKWIRANQRESGKWFTQSPVKDAGNLISNVGSAYVILALQACGELPGWPFRPTKPASR